MKVEISHCVKKPVSDSAIRKAIGETLKLLNIKSEAALSVALVGEKKMRSLNKVWRGKDSPTDVLSFSFLESGNGDAEETKEAGEIIICLPVAARQARPFPLNTKKTI